jgi:hypothetical protein
VNDCDRTSIRCVPRAVLKLLGYLTRAGSSASPVLFNDLAVPVVLILFKDIRAGGPAHTTAYAAITIYCYVRFVLSYLTTTSFNEMCFTSI